MSTTNTTTAVAVRPVDLLKNMINSESVQQQFQNALGKHKDGFVASLIDLYTGDRALQTCKPQDVIMQALKAATLNLPLNKALGFSYIVVYNNNVKSVDAQGKTTWTKVPTPTFIPGYKGYIQLAMRTGQYRTINADIVYEGELRKVNKLSGEIAFDGDKTSDKVIGYFCYFELLNGFSKTLYMSVEDMATYCLRYSPSFKNAKDVTVAKLVEMAQSTTIGKQVGWEGNFNDMALKTVIRRLLGKYGYLSIEMQNAIEKDEEHDNTSYGANERNKENAEELTAVDIDAVPVEEDAKQTEEPTTPAATGPAY